ncbi:protein transport protein SEC16A homolog, partial [Selaginella moellendorffii]|uniref:protein transport protein SEC16A homolog n=1 Tax=Selaginella moellendorffii TaxID=88036 RepID=UPI000D1C956D
LQTTPTEQKMQATAFEVKRLLIAGKQKEALRAAQDGQLWGCALLMARQLGEKFYTDTIAEMAQRQFQPGFPLWTLTLLYAGQHAGVFVGNTNLSNVTALQPQPVPASAVDGATQDAVEGMLEEWQENLAIMAANRTNGDERVIMHLGDCLWRHRDEICGAHICYLVANASFEPFSPSARLCLIGADHCKYPRTYTSPEAIQQMEVYEFARVTSNSQFILLPFQPYKLIYVSMLAEAGKINEALRYCQAVLKTLKTVGHAADVCKEAAVALEERLRIHSQGGLTSIVQRIFGNIGLHKMTGPSFPKASDMLILITVPQQLLAEAVYHLPRKAWRQHKFRYDETLKRWVEEGAEAQAPELLLAPPPTANKLLSRVEENGAPISMSPERPQPTPERPQLVVSGIPPMPPSSNQYAAHAHQNVTSRYVDTFNKGSVTPSKTSSDSPPLFGMVPKATVFLYGLPKDVVSDWDSMFTLEFWQTRQGIWEKYLPLLEFAHNCALHLAIEMALFMAMYGFQPWSPVGMNLASLKEHQAKELADEHCQHKYFQVGDKVFLQLSEAQ